MWFGPGTATLAFVIGLFLAVAPALPHDRTWARSLMALCGSVLLLRYLAWRVGATLEVDGLGMAGQLWVWTCLGAELLLIFDNFLSLLVMSRWADRSHEADRHAARLRSTPASELPTVDVFIPTYNEDLEVLERTIVGAQAHRLSRRDRVWVLDDGRRDWLEEFCDAQGVGLSDASRQPPRQGRQHQPRARARPTASSSRSSMPTSCRTATSCIARSASSRTRDRHRADAAALLQSGSGAANLGAPRLFPDEQRFFFDACCPAATPGTPLSAAAPTA